MSSLELSEEQVALRDSVRKAFQELFPHEYLYLREKTPRISDPEKWKELSQLGLSEYFTAGGALHGSLVRDLSLVASEVGRALCPETIIESIFSSAYLPTTSTRATWGGNIQSLVIQAEKGSKVTLSGEIKAVLGGNSESLLFVAGERSTRGLYQVELTANLAIKTRERASLDLLRPLTDLSLKNSPAIQVGDKAKSDNVLLVASLLSACELSGIANKAIEMTVEYVKTRKQYGVPVGGFQAVQHQLADMHLRAEAVGALTNFASWTFEASPDQSEVAVLSALRTAREAVPWIIERAIQLHGGIGFTWEFVLHLYLRRARLITILSPDTHEEVDRLIHAAL